MNNDRLHEIPKVVRINHDKTAVRIDRQTRYGNPFVLGIDGTRDMVCDAFEAYAEWRLQIQPNWLEPLRGKNLACHCAPLRCHGDTLVRLANR